MNKTDEELPEIDYEQLDPGIRETVRRLRAWGFDTTDSGDGSKAETMECGLSVANVFIRCEPRHLVDSTDLLMRNLVKEGICVEPIGSSLISIQSTYDPADGTAIIGLYGVRDSSWRD